MSFYPYMASIICSYVCVCVSVRACVREKSAAPSPPAGSEECWEPREALPPPPPLPRSEREAWRSPEACAALVREAVERAAGEDADGEAWAEENLHPLALGFNSWTFNLWEVREGVFSCLCAGLKLIWGVSE